ncbi:MAG: hypothetical protein R3F36_05205 [Candidatus Competibacteraceae bacterium]
MLPVADAEKIRALLQNYLDQRILFYTAQHDRLLQQKINIRTTQLQNELWSAIQALAAAQPTPIVALAVSGMNDVLNSQGYCPGCSVEPNSRRGMGSYDGDRHLLQCIGRLRFARHHKRNQIAAGSPADCFHRVHADSRYRCSTPRRHSRAPQNLIGLAESLRVPQ